MQQGVGLRVKPNAAGCGQGVAAFYRPVEAVEGRGNGRLAVSVRHQIIGRLRERRLEDELHFMRGKEEEATTLRMLDSTAHRRATGGKAERQRSVGMRQLGLWPKEEEGQLGRKEELGQTAWRLGPAPERMGVGLLGRSV
jgi:hypothetical protein